ncbi:MAG: hypothetical protein Q8M29_13250 [Bacteroidota bacterium]|nr:hypothetical protein [Bacteroidota bacterium]
MASFKSLSNNLKTLANQFGADVNLKKLKYFQALHKTAMPANKELTEHQHLLLFLSAHPNSKEFLDLVNKEKERLAKHIKKQSPAKLKKELENSGLPYTPTLSCYSHDLLEWLQQNDSVQMTYDYSTEEEIELNHVLQFTLPELEKGLTAAGNLQEDLLSELQVKPPQFLSFLIDQFSNLNKEPFIKDYFWNKLSVYVELKSEEIKFSKLYNQLSFDTSYFHTNLLRSFDHIELLNTELPYFTILKPEQQEELIEVMRMSLLLLGRETDPTTFIDRRSLRFYQLERGISIAIYGMTANRQLPMESYVGYTLFKNGYPAAYGGGWVHGRKALFGINIFEQFRGGESGYMFMQLLRVYRQVFEVDYFEVEPYQYGLDNPEGIESGAFWFYYRYGFRPLDKELNTIAENEYSKIKSKKGYRTNAKTLTRFTESNIALNLGTKVPQGVLDLRKRVTDYIAYNYKGHRSTAAKESIAWFRDKANFIRMCNKYEEAMLPDIALLARAMNINDETRLGLLKEMILTKPTDMYAFQEALVEFWEA